MKKFVLGMIIAATAFAVQAELINIDLGSGTSVGAGTAGVVASDGWQLKAGSPDITTASALNYATGGASGATVLLDGTGNLTSIGAATTDGDYNMFNRGMGIGAVTSGNISNPYNVRIAGLDTVTAFAGGYDVYVYFGSAINYSGVDVVTPVTVSNGSENYFLTVAEHYATYSGSYIQGTATVLGDAVAGNYVKFSGMTGATFDIFATASGASDSVATITGLQIVAVPEPATVGMLGLGALVALLIRRVRG